MALDSTSNNLKYCIRFCTGPHAQLERKVLYHKNNEQREYTPMPHPVVKEASRYDNIYVVFKQEAALDQLVLRKLLFIDRVDTSHLPARYYFSPVIAEK